MHKQFAGQCAPLKGRQGNGFERASWSREGLKTISLWGAKEKLWLYIAIFLKPNSETWVECRRGKHNVIEGASIIELGTATVLCLKLRSLRSPPRFFDIMSADFGGDKHESLRTCCNLCTQGTWNQLDGQYQVDEQFLCLTNHHWSWTFPRGRKSTFSQPPQPLPFWLF